jgi:uncharacterized protein YeeX (DUF496 family)
MNKYVHEQKLTKMIDNIIKE